MIRFAYISPPETMKQAMSKSSIHLALAHINNDCYIQNFAERIDCKKLILDNGAYENGKPLDVKTLLIKGKEFKANTIVLPDYPGGEAEENIKKQLKNYDKIKGEGFNVMFVPQSIRGDIEGYLKCFKTFDYYADKDDLIGLSILGAPNALPNIPRSFARWEVLQKLQISDKRIHMLGLLDTVYEIALCKQFEFLINSWDSSMPVWSAYKNFYVDTITDKKFLGKVNFYATSKVNENLLFHNINYTERLLNE